MKTNRTSKLAPLPAPRPMKTTTATLDARINDLQPGASLVLSRGNGFAVKAERSGRGDVIRIVRESRAGFTVLSTTPYTAC